MTLFFPLLEKPLQFEENSVNELIIENPLSLRGFLENLQNQIDGVKGELLLAENYEPLELSGAALLLADPLRIDTSSKKIAGRIQQEALRAAEDSGETLQKIMAAINELAAEISLMLDFEAVFDPLETPEGLIKLMGFRFDRDGLSLPERLLEWMRLNRRFLGKRLFVLYGLRAFLTGEEHEELLRAICCEKLDVLLVEPFQRSPAGKGVIRTIIDEDLCLIT